MSYKYTINPLNVKFIFFIFLTYIFLEFVSLKYLCTFSLYKVTYLNIKESQHLQKKKKKLFAGISYQPPWFTKHQEPVTNTLV
jgi:hypothetical protein